MKEGYFLPSLVRDSRTLKILDLCTASPIEDNEFWDTFVKNINKRINNFTLSIKDNMNEAFPIHSLNQI